MQSSHPSGAASPALPRGALLNDSYRVERVLGQPGGFGITYLAVDLRLETRVAIKEFLPRELAGRSPGSPRVSLHSAEDAELFRSGLQGFLNEARIIARLDHPNLVRVRTFFEANDTAYLVMDYYQGMSLDEYLRGGSGPLPSLAAVEIMVRILDGLSAAHSHHILHRDVKPGNIYLTVEGRPVLLDFGAARHSVAGQERSITAILTPSFAPIEQYVRDSRKQGPWTDVYGAAATLYWMVTGSPPPDVVERLQEDTLVEPTRLVPDIPGWLNSAILWGLAVHPHQRPQTAREFQAVLLQQGSESLSSGAPNTAPPARPLSASGAPGTRVWGSLARSARNRVVSLVNLLSGGTVGRPAEPASAPIPLPAPARDGASPATPSRVVRCEQGHPYDAARLQRCPFCGAPQASLDVSPTIEPVGTPPGAEDHAIPSAEAPSAPPEPVYNTIAFWSRRSAAPGLHRLALARGTLLRDRFEIQELIRRPGRFTITYAASDTALERPVIVREYFPQDLVDRMPDGAVVPHGEEEEEFFIHGISFYLKEGRSLARLEEHPNLVRVLDSFAANGTAYLEMERYRGESLASRLRMLRGRLSHSDALGLMTAVLDGLTLAHGHGILHRDVSPESILLCEHGPVLIGFGGARQAAREHAPSTAALPVTAYSALEQYARNGEQGPWTDVYACAAVLYHAVTGQAPPAATERLGHDRLVPPSRLVPSIPRAVSEVIVAGLELLRGDRPQDAGEYLRLLRAAAAEPGASAAQESHPPLPGGAAATSARDVFISFSDRDRAVAARVCAALEQAGLRCWMSTRDIQPGAGWAEAVMEALSTSRVVVLLYSANSSASGMVTREIERAVSRNIEIVPMRIDDVAPSPAMEFFVGAQQWLDAVTPPLEPHLARLTAVVGAKLAHRKSS